MEEKEVKQILDDIKKSVDSRDEQIDALTKEIESLKSADNKEPEKKENENDTVIKAMEKEIKELKEKSAFGSVSFVTEHDKEKSKEAQKTKVWSGIFRGEKAVSEGSDGSGGYYIPEEWSSDLIDTVTRYGFARQFGTVYPMSSDTLNVQKPSALTGYFIDENSEITEQTPGESNIQFSTSKIAAIIKMSNEWLEDVNPAVVNKMIELIGVAIARREDWAVFSADGTSDSTDGGYTGLLHNTDIGSVVLGSTELSPNDATWADLSAMIDAMTLEYNVSDPRFMFNKTFRAHLRTLADTAEYGSPWKANSPNDVENLWGYPIVWNADFYDDYDSDLASKPFGLFGDMSKIGIGDRRRIAVKTDPYRFSEYDQTAIIVTERVDFQVLEDTAFARILTAAS